MLTPGHRRLVGTSLYHRLFRVRGLWTPHQWVFGRGALLCAVRWDRNPQL